MDANDMWDDDEDRVHVNAMLAAAPKPAQSCDMGELCLGCSPRNPDGSCPDAAQAEKQEPVKDEPVAWWHYRINGEWDGFSKQNPPEDAYDGGTLTPLYTRPQPDLTAEVERLRKFHEFNVREKANLRQRIAELESEVERLRAAHEFNFRRWQQQEDRIAELEVAAREAHGILIAATGIECGHAEFMETLRKLDAVLGNAALTERGAKD